MLSPFGRTLNATSKATVAAAAKGNQMQKVQADVMEAKAARDFPPSCRTTEQINLIVNKMKGQLF